MRRWLLGEPCDGTGVTTTDGACVYTSLPWNPAGTRKVPSKMSFDPDGPTPDTPVKYPTLYVRPDLVFKKKFVVFYDTQLTSVIYQLVHPICSLSLARLGGRDYMLGAVCGQAFIAYLDLTAGPGKPSLGVLIGQAGNPGWADGFKTQARFQSELYVAKGTDDKSLWVLDRWNCLVREVTVWDTTGRACTRCTG